jgi:hypothetical protein
MWELCTIIIIGLIIGLPTILVGCNDYSCPLHQRITSNTTKSQYIGASCSKSECSSSGDTCTQTNYDCSYWVTTVSYTQGHGLNECEVESGPHNPGSDVLIYVSKTDSTCHIGFDKTITVLPIVGIVFLTITVIAFLALLVVCYCCLTNNK